MQPVIPQAQSPQSQDPARLASSESPERYQTGYGCLMLTALTILCCMIFIAAIVLFGPEITTPT